MPYFYAAPPIQNTLQTVTVQCSHSRKHSQKKRIRYGYVNKTLCVTKTTRKKGTQMEKSCINVDVFHCSIYLFIFCSQRAYACLFSFVPSANNQAVCSELHDRSNAVYKLSSGQHKPNSTEAALQFTAG